MFFGFFAKAVWDADKMEFSAFGGIEGEGFRALDIWQKWSDRVLIPGLEGAPKRLEGQRGAG